MTTSDPCGAGAFDMTCRLPRGHDGPHGAEDVDRYLAWQGTSFASMPKGPKLWEGDNT